MNAKDSIKEYFKGKNIFITGGSGFVGKVLIEKLLRSFPDLGKIYVLLRPKKGKVLYERVEQITSTPLFDRLKSESPESLQKIVPINGDAAKLRLGISDADRELLKKEIHVFFNVAASVKFDDFLRYSIFANLRSARDAALLALDMKNIEVFLYVSTTFCNIDERKFIEENLYPQPGDWREAILIAEKCNSETFDILSQKFISGFPNTYTYTKRLAEHCVNDLLVGKIPTIICRPSVVVASVEEPFQGWIDNFNGPIGLSIAGAAGLLRILYADPETNTDYFAVDNVVKCMIVSTWHKVNSGDVSKPSIYHLSKNDLLPYRLGNILESGKRIRWDLPFENKIWFPRNKCTKCWYDYYIQVLLFHMLPAFFLDILLMIVGQKPIIVKIQRKIYIANIAISHFMFNEWKFDNKNGMSLLATIPQTEIKDFNFLIFPQTDEAIYNYSLQSANNCRIHLLKESKTITEANITKTKRMYYLDIAVKVTFWMIVAWLFFIRINVPAKIWNIIYNYFAELK